MPSTINMAQQKVNMPSSGAGITQYFNETKSVISIPPQMILGISIVIIAIVILLNSL